MIHNITYKTFVVTFPIDSYPSSWYFDFFTFEFEVDKCVSFVRVQPFHRRWNRDVCSYYYSTYYYYIHSFPRRGGEWWQLYRGTKHRGIYLALFTDPGGDSCFSIYQISWIKLKKVTFCKLKTSHGRNSVYNLQTFQVHFTILLQIEHENNFLPNQWTPRSQSSSLSWYLFVRLLHLSHKFRLPEMSRNETPSWLRLQNSE